MQNEDVFVGGFEVLGMKLCWGILRFESFENIIESVGVLEPTGRLEFQGIPGKMCKILSCHVFYRVMWLPLIYAHFHLQDHPAFHIPKHPNSHLLRFGKIGPPQKHTDQRPSRHQEVLLMASEIRLTRMVVIGGYNPLILSLFSYLPWTSLVLLMGLRNPAGHHRFDVCFGNPGVQQNHLCETVGCQFPRRPVENSRAYKMLNQPRFFL